MSLATAGLAVCWDANDVARWLDNNELGIYAGSFLANDIDELSLLEFSQSTISLVSSLDLNKGNTNEDLCPTQLYMHHQPSPHHHQP